MITVSSCGVKLQEVLLGLEKKKAKTLDIHMHFCGFSQHSFFFFFHLGCNFFFLMLKHVKGIKKFIRYKLGIQGTIYKVISIMNLDFLYQ